MKEPIFCAKCGRKLIERLSLADSSVVFVTCPKIWGKYSGWLRGIFNFSDHTDAATLRYFPVKEIKGNWYDTQTGERLK